jgi:CHAT domain-containing protein
MKRRRILHTIPLIFTGWGSFAYAEHHQNDVTQLFDIAAAKHKQELRDLHASRAVRSRNLSDTSSSHIAQVLSVKQNYRNYGGVSYPDKSAVLFYSYDDLKSLQVWLLNENGIQAYHKQFISKEQITQAISNLRHSLNVTFLQQSRQPRQRSDIDVVKHPAHGIQSQEISIANLTRILLPTPIANQLDLVKHLIVVPVLDIGTVPYALLKPFPNDTFLINRMSISIAPSLFDLGDLLGKIDIESLSASPLIVGNPYLPESSDWSIPSLPDAEQEAQTVANIMNTVPLIGKDATKNAIIDRVREASLLYFATHGISSHSEPLSGGFLMLSAEKMEQGWWTAREIQKTPLRAKIAILSACQTGLGKAHDAGIIGLARAFQIAGVPRVVMSLWNVDDQATSHLMQAFMRNLDRYIPSEALRQAMFETRNDYPEPSKWASFMMFGTPR